VPGSLRLKKNDRPSGSEISYFLKEHHVRFFRPDQYPKERNVAMKTIHVLLMCALAFLISSCGTTDRFGRVLTLKGPAETYTGSKWVPLKKSCAINYRDTIKTTTGTLEIGFRKNSKIVLEPNTKMVVTDSVFNDKPYIFPVVLSGGVLCDVKHDSADDFSFVVYTPVAYAGAAGTHFHVAHTPATARSTVNVFDGRVVVYNTADFSEPVYIAPGFTTTIAGTARPWKPAKIKYPQFRRIGYLLPPDECEEYEVAFGFPVGPIPFPDALIVPVPVQVEAPEADIPEPPAPVAYEPRHGKSHHRANVNVNVNVNGSLPGIGFAGVPLPVPVAPVPMHPAHVPVPVPVPMGVGVPVPGVAPVPVPVPMGVPVPVPGVVVHQGQRREHVSHARPKY
jgi:hypothetical protein